MCVFTDMKINLNFNPPPLSVIRNTSLTLNQMQSQVFPQYVDLGQRLFKFMHTISRATTSYLGTVAFRQQCERYLGIMDDAKILECYVRMYAQIDNPDFVDKEGVTRLLHICYTIAMQHSGNPVLCSSVSVFYEIIYLVISLVLH